MNEENETFSYSYSANQQEEINAIKQKYAPKTEDKIDQLRELDRGVTKKGTVISVIVGIIGALLLGVGMCCTMVWADKYFVAGIVVGIIGIAVIAAAYPIFSHITKKEKERIAPQILKLANELTIPKNHS